MEKDPRYQDRTRRDDQRAAPEPERPVPREERRREETPADKPSQAEGERD